MLFFGPISSLFDFATFGVMLWVFHAGPAPFRSGWFVESLATQTLVIFAIRTRRIPFFRSHPSLPLLLAALGVVTAGAVLPATPLAHALGFEPLPGLFYLALTLLVASYLVLIEIGKRWFYRAAPPVTASRSRTPHYRLLRRAARFTTASPARLPRPVARQVVDEPEGQGGLAIAAVAAARSGDGSRMSASAGVQTGPGTGVSSKQAPAGTALRSAGPLPAATAQDPGGPSTTRSPCASQESSRCDLPTQRLPCRGRYT